MKSTRPIRLFLVRHGNTFEAGQTPTQVGSKTDLPLTSDGRKQAGYFGDFLKAEELKPVALYAGPLKRQKESAKIISEILSIEDKVHSNTASLNEIDYGAWEGLTSDEITAKWPEEYRKWTHQAEWPSDIFGGSFEKHKKDIKDWLDIIRKNYSSEDVIVGITSNGVIRFFQSFNEDHWATLKRDNKIEDLKVKTGNYCLVNLYPDHLEVVKWNVNPKK